MNADKTIQLLLNPIRMRIAQFLAVHPNSTTKQIATSLSDVPVSSLYRHIKQLESANLIVSTTQTKVRGVIEHAYSMSQAPPGNPSTNADFSSLIQQALLASMHSFETYLSKESSDPVKDMLFVSSCVLLLDDLEYQELLTQVSGCISAALENHPKEGRKPRKLSLISEPTK